ncbi:LysE family translocator [Corynebacterium sp. SCR221107]|uniref:LysE family translocator n=1 Tax=Corynebacterium sp. SCR221107 TaxID=3017361 RepID=UPI0022EC2689|nr:LysE family translocator [Corynebacterium sp. SCR221107]WBT08179.1 LysE family translocator [Corynebacterium sp. SCR221107]
MGASALLSLAGLNLAGMATPGPDIFLITRLATRSRAHALAAVFGIATGILFWVTLTVTGAATLLTAYPAVLELIQVLGGAWIIYMGVRMLQAARAQWGKPVAGADVDPSRFLGSRLSSYRNGLTTNLANPKVIIYFSAIVAPLLPASPSFGTAAAVIAVVVASNILGFGVLSLAISTEANRRRFLSISQWIDLTAGVFFIIAGALLIFSGVA